jgi:hypothetical protein
VHFSGTLLVLGAVAAVRSARTREEATAGKEVASGRSRASICYLFQCCQQPAQDQNVKTRKPVICLAALAEAVQALWARMQQAATAAMEAKRYAL